MDLIRSWECKAGAQMWLDDNLDIEGEPVLVRVMLDNTGRTTRETWAVRTADGYVML